MSVKLHLPASLSGIARDRRDLDVEGATVGDCLDHLVALLPKMKDQLFYATGGESTEGSRRRLRSSVDLRLNARRVTAEGLDGPARDGDELRIKLNFH